MDADVPQEVPTTDAEGDVEMGSAEQAPPSEATVADAAVVDPSSAPSNGAVVQAQFAAQQSGALAEELGEAVTKDEEAPAHVEEDADMPMADAEGSAEAETTPPTQDPAAPAAAVEDQHQRMEVIDNMEKIEREFSDLKEKLYQDQIQWLRADMAEIKRGTDEQFLEQCKELDADRQEKLWRAEQWKQHILHSVESMFQAELKQATDEFEAEKRHLRSKMLTTLQSQMAKLEDEKNTITLVADSSESRSSARLSRRKTKDQSIKELAHKKSQPSHINYSLRDSEVYEDLNYMSKCQPTDANFELERWLALAPLM